MSELSSLYQELILDHVKRPRGYGLREAADGESHQLNPTCGDEVTCQVHLDGDTIEAITWKGQGCMISQSSASIAAELLTGLDASDARGRIDAFRTAIRSRGEIAIDEELLGDAIALEGASKYVARVKCAMLGWVGIEAALAQALVAQSAGSEPSAS